MSNSSTRWIGSPCLREDLLWKYNQTALQRYQFDKNFQNEEENFDPFQCSGGVGIEQAKLWGSKLEENHQPYVCSSSWCGARVICKLESMEGESFYKPFHFPLPECFSLKMLSLETNALGLLHSVFNQSLVFRLVGWSRWSCLNRWMHLKTLEIL